MKPEAVSLPLLQALRERVFSVPRVRAAIDAVFAELAAELRSTRESPHATAVVPIDLFTGGLRPELARKVRLCRAFLLRRGARMAAPEVHRNSVQRLASYRGGGWIHQTMAGGWVARELRSPDPRDPVAEPIDRSWDIVSAGVWHFPEAGADEDWATVTFHSASEEEIVDELWETE